MTWVWDAANGCWRGVSDATITAWRAWRVLHPSWHPAVTRIVPNAIRCVKGVALGLPLALGVPPTPYAVQTPYSSLQTPWAESYGFAPAGYPLPLGSAYGPGPVASGFIPPFSVPSASDVQPVPTGHEQPVILPSAIPPTSHAPPMPVQPVVIPEPGTLSILAFAVAAFGLIRKRTTQ